MERLVADPFGMLVAAFVSMTTDADGTKAIHGKKKYFCWLHEWLMVCPSFCVQCTSSHLSARHLWPSMRMSVRVVCWEQCLCLVQ